MIILNVAEKPDAAKNISQILSGGHFLRREGRSKFNKIFQFECHSPFFNCNARMIFTSVTGHLLNIEFCRGFGWNEVASEVLFQAPIEWRCLNPEIADTLSAEARNCDKLIIWTDCDREGEAIGYEVVLASHGAINRQNSAPYPLSLSKIATLDIYRARFSAITPSSIIRAWNELGRLDMRQVDAVHCRQEIDLRTGAAFTRLQTHYLQRMFPQMIRERRNNQVVSYGPCQFPTLGFVVDRYLQRKEFVKEPFWRISVKHFKDGKLAEFYWDRKHLFDRDVCKILYEFCSWNPLATVSKIVNRPKSRWRPVPLDTVALEKLAIKKLRMTSKNALNLAEKLYTKGFISYPRTETTKFLPGFDLNSLLQQQTIDQRWGDFAGRVLERGANARNGSKSDDAHPPIHPLKHATPADLTLELYSLYELVTRHFIACCSWDASGRENRVEICLNGEGFSTTGLSIYDQGYLEVYPYDKWTGRQLADYSEGENLSITRDQIQMVEGHTEPPNLLTEADLITLMDKHGIGTDATHAEHIQTIQTRFYALLEEGKFRPGFLGLGLVEGYENMGNRLSRPYLRAQMEEDLKKICDGVQRKNNILHGYLDNYAALFIEAGRNISKLSIAIENQLGEQQPQNNQNVSVRPQTYPPQGAPSATVPQPPPESERQHACDCGAPARFGVTKKAGPNKGRPFYGCCQNFSSKTRCNFFVWADGVDQQNLHSGFANPNDNYAGTTHFRHLDSSRQAADVDTSNFPPQSANNSSSPLCHCNASAVLKITGKGKNKGKRYWTCAKTAKKCPFFNWA